MYSRHLSPSLIINVKILVMVIMLNYWVKTWIP